MDKLKPIVENVTGLSPIVMVSAKKQYPTDVETYYHRVLEDGSVNYKGNNIIVESDGRIYALQTPTVTGTHIKNTGVNSITIFTLRRMWDNTVITSNGDDPETFHTKITRRDLRQEARQNNGQAKGGYIVLSDTYTVTADRDFQSGDVAGNVLVYSNQVITYTTYTKTFPTYSAFLTASYVVAHFTYAGASYVYITDFDALPDEVASRTSIENLEMMPLIRIRDNVNANANGVDDSVYETYTVAQLKNNGAWCGDIPAGEERPECAVPRSHVPEEGESNYARYHATSQVLRGLGMTLDAVTNMVCGGVEELDKISGGYVQFAINPLAQRVKPGLSTPDGKVLKIGDATDSQKEYIKGTAYASYEFFKIMADATNFPVDKPTGWDAMTNVYYYGFQTGTFNQSINLMHIADTTYLANANDAHPVGSVTMSVHRTEGDLEMTKQLSSTVRRKLYVYSIQGVTSIKRKVPENEDGSGPLVDAADVVYSSLKTDSESLLLLPLSIDFTRELSANDKLELFYSSAQLLLYASEAQYLNYYETEAFSDFIAIVLVIVTIIITIVTWGAGWWIGPLIGLMLMGGGMLYADYTLKKMEEENKRLEEQLAKLAEEFKKALNNGNATDVMQDMVLTLTDVVGVIMQNVDINIPLDVNQVFAIGLGDLQYNNDMLYKEKYQIYCDTKSEIRFKMPVSKQ